MNGRRKTLPGAALLAALSIAAPAAAQEGPRLELTLVGGAGYGTRVKTGPAEEVRVAAAGLAGVRLGWAFSRSFRLEAGWTTTSADLLARDPRDGGASEEAGKVDTDAFELNAFYDFGGPSTRGYLGVGAGAMALSPVPPALSESKTRFTVNAAVGVRQALGGRLAVRAEGRYRWRDGRDRVGTVICDADECRLFATNWYSSAELTAGLSVRF